MNFTRREAPSRRGGVLGRRAQATNVPSNRLQGRVYPTCDHGFADRSRSLAQRDHGAGLPGSPKLRPERIEASGGSLTRFKEHLVDKARAARRSRSTDLRWWTLGPSRSHSGTRKPTPSGVRPGSWGEATPERRRTAGRPQAASQSVSAHDHHCRFTGEGPLRRLGRRAAYFTPVPHLAMCPEAAYMAGMIAGCRGRRPPYCRVQGPRPAHRATPAPGARSSVQGMTSDPGAPASRCGVIIETWTMRTRDRRRSSVALGRTPPSASSPRY